jgi:hypothetical protein
MVLGIVRLVRPLQYANTCVLSAVKVALLGIVMLVSPEQYLNAYSLMLVTVLGSDILVRPVQLLKA